MLWADGDEADIPQGAAVAIFLQTSRAYPHAPALNVVIPDWLPKECGKGAGFRRRVPISPLLQYRDRLPDSIAGKKCQAHELSLASFRGDRPNR
jgi:hypothetical protein